MQQIPSINAELASQCMMHWLVSIPPQQSKACRLPVLKGTGQERLALDAHRKCCKSHISMQGSKSQALYPEQSSNLVLKSRSKLLPASATKATLTAAGMQQPMQARPGQRAWERGAAAAQARPGRHGSGMARG